MAAEGGRSSPGVPRRMRRTNPHRPGRKAAAPFQPSGFNWKVRGGSIGETVPFSTVQIDGAPRGIFLGVSRFLGDASLIVQTLQDRGWHEARRGGGVRDGGKVDRAFPEVHRPCTWRCIRRPCTNKPSTGSVHKASDRHRHAAWPNTRLWTSSSPNGG